MRHPLLIIMVCLALTACVPQSNSNQAGLSAGSGSSLSGDWQDDNGAYFSLDPDGILGLPGQSARSGLGWSRQGETLVLKTLDTPGGTPKEDRLGIVKSETSRLELRRDDGQITIWRKIVGAVRRLDGTVIFRERIALPPQIVVSAKLRLPGSDTPLASSLALISGQGELPFRVHYLVRDAGEHIYAMLEAVILLENECLFATAAPWAASLGQSPRIILQRSLPGEADPKVLLTPAQFQGSKQGPNGDVTLDLYLEPNGFYLLRSTTGSSDADGIVHVGRWQQIDRNHTVQLGRGSNEPLAASLRPAGSLLLATHDVPGGEIELIPVVLPLLDTPFRMIGTFHIQDGKAVLTNCASALDFEVHTSGVGFAALEQAYRKNPAEGSLLVECEVIVRHPGGPPAPAVRGSVTDIHLIEITRVISARPGFTCADPYASSPLEQTYWRLMILGDRPAQTFPDQAEPHLILRDQNQATGSDGCNNFFMQWKVSNNTINFQPGGSTLMLCPEGDAQARDMMEALASADSWLINGSVLELRKKGKPVATFEAVAL